MKGYTKNIEEETLKNEAFRHVLYTTDRSQLVIMSLLPNEDIGEEVHKDTDQFLRIEQGEGTVVLEDDTYNITDGSAIIVPAGTKHNIINTGSNMMKLYTIYTPPHHRDGIIHDTKVEAEADEDEHFDGDITD